jgi:putative ABC transport system permease protein
MATFFRGDSGDVGALAPLVINGHWPRTAHEVAVSGQVMKERGLRVGDSITLELNGHRASAVIVADIFTDGSVQVAAGNATLDLLDPGARADSYVVQVKHGTDLDSFSAAVHSGDAGLQAFAAPGGNSGGAKVIDAAVTLLTLMLATVAALGVFNTVVLNTRERRRDLGMLKSIGMTPRQVIVMLLTSMGLLGLVGGLLGVPLGIGAHRWVVPAMVHSGQLAIPALVLHVFTAPLVVALGLAAVAIAVLGAFIPSRTAAWSPIAEVLHNE